MCLWGNMHRQVDAFTRSIAKATEASVAAAIRPVKAKGSQQPRKANA